MRWRALLLALLAIPALTGCWSRIEVNDLAIITMAGLDRDPDDALRVSLQIVVPHRIPHPGGGGVQTGSPVHVISGTGTSVEEVVQRLQLQTARRLYFAHVNPVLIGERLASSGIQPVEDFLNRLSEMRLQSYLLVVRGDPLEILQARPESERLPSEAVRQLERSSVGLTIAVWQWNRDRRTEGLDPVMPWLKAVPSVEKRPEQAAPDPDFKTEGSALFAGARLVAWLDDAGTRGLRLLRGEKIPGRLTEPFGDMGVVGVRIERTQVQRSVIYKRGKPGIAVQARVQVTLEDLQPPIDARDPAVVTRLEEAISKGIAAEMQGTLERARELGVDPFGFGFIIHQQNPRLWHRIGGGWRQQFRDLPVTISVKVDIDRSQLVHRPRSIPDGEMLRK